MCSCDCFILCPIILQSYCYQDSMALAQKQKYRSMKQDKGPRDQAPLFMGFSRQEDWSGLPCPAMPFSRGSSQPRDEILLSYISCIGMRVLYHQHHLGSPFCKPIHLRSFHCSVTQSCPALCDPMDCSTPGFPVLHYLLEFG